MSLSLQVEAVVFLTARDRRLGVKDLSQLRCDLVVVSRDDIEITDFQRRKHDVD